MNRRHFLQTTLATSAWLATQPLVARPAAAKMLVCIFSKHLQWTDSYTQMAEVAAEIGFDGIDLTVRPGGHVTPETVETDLPKAAEAIRKAGLALPMMVTNLTKADTEAEKVLRTASTLGISYYRTGNYFYNLKADLPEQIRQFSRSLKGLSLVNKKYNLVGCYQNHASMPPTYYAGAAIWDLPPLLAGIDSRWMGVQYDIHHATAEGGDNWAVNLHLIAPRIQTLAIKDFYWIFENGKRQKQNCPLGEGMVDFKTYLPLIRQLGFSGPVSMHFEQPLGGAEHGNRVLTISSKEVITRMKKDLTTLRNWLTEAGF